MKIKLAIALGLLIWQVGRLSAQYLPVSPELASKLQGKSNFFDIMAAVDTYYEKEKYYDNPRLNSEYKKWNRWSWFAARHLNAEGIVDYRSGEYLDESQKIIADARLRTNSGGWTFTGPFSLTWANNVGSKGIGRVDRLAFHPTDGNIILAATPAGGLWKTVDGGQNWFCISGNIPNCGISGIVISSDDPTGNKIFILTGDGDSGNGGFVFNYGYQRPTIGVLGTLNGGATWFKVGNSESMMSGRLAFKLIQVRGTPGRMLAAMDNGIYRTEDFGLTWTLSDLIGFAVYDIEQHPTNNAILYAAANFTVKKSTNGGVSFNNDPTFNPSTGTASRSALAVTPNQPNEVYYLQCGTSTNLYQSTNSGDNFTSINTNDLIGGQYTYNCAFAINPTNNANMVVGGINVSSSNNTGSTFGNVTVGVVNNVPIPPNYIHSDIHDLAFNPVNNILYAGCDGGVFRSLDNGVNWEERYNGLSSSQYYHMDGFDGAYHLLIAGAQDNGTIYTTDGNHMSYCGTGDGFSVDFVSGDNNVFYLVENRNVFRFTRSTSARVLISPGTNTDQTFYPNVIAHPTNNSIVYVGYANSIWRSSNQGGSWTNISNTGTSNNGSGHTGGFAVSAQAPDRLYAANATLLRRSDDQGANWTTISGNTGWPVNFGVMTDICSRSTNANEIWVAMTGSNGANRIFYSPDAGNTWNNFTGSLPNIPVYSITYTDDGDVYIGTELGIYFMDYAMSDWVPYYNGMPFVPVTDVFVDEGAGIIQASTFGRGLWQSDLYSDCGPFLLLSGPVDGANFYQSNGFIETSQVMQGSFGNKLVLRSPVKITFENGFRAFYNSKLHAVIGNCGQGVINAAAPKPVTNPPPTAGQVLDDKNKIERDEDDDD